MFDYSFFALLFLLATSLAPDAGAERAWINSRYPEQSITWTPEGEGWAMRVNGREMGIFHLDGDAVVHHTGQGRGDREVPDAVLDVGGVLHVQGQVEAVGAGDQHREAVHLDDRQTPRPAGGLDQGPT